MKIARFGWIRDALDFRDRPYELPRPGTLPPKVDLRPSFPPPYDQGELGSCVGNAVAGALAYCRAMQGRPAFTPSRLMIYYDARAIEGTAAIDAGAQIRDGIKAAAGQGACPEELWPYDPARFAVRPSPEAYAAASRDRLIAYRRVPQEELGAIRDCLASGDPIVFGISAFAALESEAVAENGVVPMPRPGEAPIGGHAIVAVGYDDEAQDIIFRNSWGAWGDGGYGYLPFSYITDPSLAADLWAVRLVSP